MKIIETPRLILRTWKQEDAQSYLAMNNDPKVVEFLRGTMNLSEVNVFINAMNIQSDQKGYTLWATELKETGEMIGFIGLNFIDFAAHFAPAVEIGWRLGSQYWGKGYATEGALASLDFGFNQAGLSEIVAITVPVNTRSRAVMEKIGMKHDLAGDFAHPKLASDHPLSRHLLYRISK
ncbi:MAG: GNAT family N-acetyltransferase [Sphingobacteriales bacterium]